LHSTGSLFWLLPLAGPLLMAAAAPEAREGMTADRAATLLVGESELIRKGRIKEAERSLSRKMAAERRPQDRADMIEAFGIRLFTDSPLLDETTAALALDYLERAVDAYRLVLGVDHPEVASAMVRRAEVERLLHPADPAPWVDLAYEQAYRIRYRRLGPASPLTLSTLIPMAELKALRSKGDPAAIEAAAALLHQAADGAGPAGGAEAEAVRSDALAQLRRLDESYGAGQPGGPRPQILTGGGTIRCGAGDLNDALVFSGEATALDKLRAQFRQAGLDLKPCGPMLFLELGGDVDPSPVIDLLTDISAGRIAGVRMGLSESGADTPPQTSPTPDEPPR